MNYQHRSRKRKDKLLSAIENRSEMSRQIKQKLEDSVMRKVNLFIAMSLDGDNIVGGLGVIVNDFHNKKILHRMYVRIYRKRISRARNRRTFAAYSCSRYEAERDHTTLSDHGSYRFL